MTSRHCKHYATAPHDLGGLTRLYICTSRYLGRFYDRLQHVRCSARVYVFTTSSEPSRAVTVSLCVELCFSSDGLRIPHGDRGEPRTMRFRVHFHLPASYSSRTCPDVQPAAKEKFSAMFDALQAVKSADLISTRRSTLSHVLREHHVDVGAFIRTVLCSVSSQGIGLKHIIAYSRNRWV